MTRVVLIACATALLTQCSRPPEPVQQAKQPPVVTIVMTGHADQNPDIEGKPSPVAVRIFELTATSKFENAEAFALIDHEQQTLAPEEVGSQELILLPAETRTWRFQPKPGVSAIGIAALYRDIDNARWRAVAPVASSGPTRLSGDIGKLAVALNPVP